MGSIVLVLCALIYESLNFRTGFIPYWHTFFVIIESKLMWIHCLSIQVKECFLKCSSKSTAQEQKLLSSWHIMVLLSSIQCIRNARIHKFLYKDADVFSPWSDEIHCLRGIGGKIFLIIYIYKILKSFSAVADFFHTAAITS